MSQSIRFFATVPLGIEWLLAQELKNLGSVNVTEHRAGVSFVGDLALAYRVCLWSRLANRILFPISTCPAATPEALYTGIYQIDWGAHFLEGTTFAIDFTSKRSHITHTLFGAQKVKDAIVDHMRAQWGKRPSVRLDRPDLRVNVALDKDRATVSIDLSGESLHKRGYRLEGGKAPLKENLAAALLQRASWLTVAEMGGHFIDPMCGSGTLPIEAAWMAADIAPGRFRSSFGFFGWKGHSPDLWLKEVQEADKRSEAGLLRLPSITGYDSDRNAVHCALKNAERAGLYGRIRIEYKEVDQVRPRSSVGLLLVNPPYGERLGTPEGLENLYRILGSTLKMYFHGWRTSVFTEHNELVSKMGMRVSHQYALYNGPIPCTLFNFVEEKNRFLSSHIEEQPTKKQHSLEVLFQKAEQVVIDTGGPAMLANRLRKNIKHLGRWAKKNGIFCYRLYDSDLPEYAVALDIYQGTECWVHIQEYQAPPTVDPIKAEKRLIDVLSVVSNVLDVPFSHIFLKIRSRQKGTTQYEKQGNTQRLCSVYEDNLQFWVNFEDYLDTGLFLNYRMVRQWIGEHAAQKHFLNLFAYTGTATVYAARGGALSTTSVDLSNTYLNWAQRNLELNSLTGDQHSFIQADCLRWCEDSVRVGRRYDLILLDPPTFSVSKRMHGTFDIQRDHVQLIRLCMSLLQPQGQLLFSTHYQGFRLEEDGLNPFYIQHITQQTLPRDFERNPRIHRCWCITRNASLSGRQSM